MPGGPLESARRSPAIQVPVAEVRALPEHPAMERPPFVTKSPASSVVPLASQLAGTEHVCCQHEVDVNDREPVAPIVLVPLRAKDARI